jgi:hypothetical protein
MQVLSFFLYLFLFTKTVSKSKCLESNDGNIREEIVQEGVQQCCRDLILNVLVFGCQNGEKSRQICQLSRGPDSSISEH